MKSGPRNWDLSCFGWGCFPLKGVGPYLVGAVGPGPLLIQLIVFNQQMEEVAVVAKGTVMSADISCGPLSFYFRYKMILIAFLWNSSGQTHSTGGNSNIHHHFIYKEGESV